MRPPIKRQRASECFEALAFSDDCFACGADTPEVHVVVTEVWLPTETGRTRYYSGIKLCTDCGRKIEKMLGFAS